MDVDFDDDDLPEFFKVYITIHSSNFMVIPRQFADYMGRTKSGLAELKSRDRGTWRIELLDDGKELRFTDGWQAFVKENLIQDGNFMFFKYHGNLKFSFIIYDETMCEKEMVKCRRSVKDDIQEAKEKQNVKTMKQEVDDHSSPSGVKSKNAKSAVPANPFFEKSFAGYIGNFRFPTAFVKDNSLSYKSNEKMVLRTSRSASWEINIINNHGIIFMSGGWRAFVRENSINVGDICKFELLDRLEIMVHVTHTRPHTRKKGSGKNR